MHLLSLHSRTYRHGVLQYFHAVHRDSRDVLGTAHEAGVSERSGSIAGIHGRDWSDDIRGFQGRPGARCMLHTATQTLRV